MLQSFAQSQDWFCQEPLFMDDEVCLSLMKDLQGLPTPPQSPPLKGGGPGSEKPLSNEDQLSYVSDILLEDHDMQLNWNCDFFHHLSSAAPCGKECSSRGAQCMQLEDSADESLWSCLVAEKGLDEKLGTSILGSSPVLSQIDTSIFEEIAGTTLDCQNLMDTPESSEATSDYSSAGGELSTSSCSDSEEEIDVVTVVRCPSSPAPLSSLAEVTLQQQQEEQQRALQRQHIEIQLQHNYAAPCPDSPPPLSNKRSRGSDGSLRFHSSRSPSSSSSSSSSSLKYHHHHHHHSSRNSAEMEDEEERRRTHNVMERHRRNELKNCFTRLRDNVPEVSHNDKASKVVILKKARDCIYSLEDQAERLQTKKDKLRARQVALKARLELLR